MRDRRLGRLELEQTARDDLRRRRLAALFAARWLLVVDGRIVPADPDNIGLARIAELCNQAAARRARATRARVG